VRAGDVEAIERGLDAPPDVLQKMADTAFEKVIGLHNVDSQALKLVSLFKKHFRVQKSVEASQAIGTRQKKFLTGLCYT
jgi:hypothetical protein